MIRNSGKKISTMSISASPEPEDVYLFEYKPPNHPYYMLHVLRRAYPHANISIQIYNDINYYRNLVYGITPPAGKILFIPFPHVIACCDFDDHSILQPIHEDIIQMQHVAYTLEYGNPHALYLMGFHDKAMFAEFAAGPFDNNPQYDEHTIEEAMLGKSVRPLRDTDYSMWPMYADIQKLN